MDEPSATQLAEAARHGDTRAATQLIELFYARIYAFLRRHTGHDADAADLTQRTFGRAWQALPSFAGKASFNSWLHGIAHHTYVDWRRANHRTEARPVEWWEDCVATGPTPAELSAQTDLAAALFQHVDNLPAELRDTVHLHYYQELTLQETADALGIATSTVKYRLRQALETLQKQMGDQPAPFTSLTNRLS